MKGSLSHEVRMKVPAVDAWKVYGTLRLAEIVQQRLPNVVSGIDILEGDGGPGTKLHLLLPPGNPLISYSKEQFVVVDDETMTKVAQVYEGGFLNVGFTLYQVTFRIIQDHPDDGNSCTVKTILDYEYPEEAAAYAEFISIEPFVDIMNAASDYLVNGPVAN